MSAPILAIPVKKTHKYSVDERVLKAFESSPYLAFEITISTGSLSRARKFVQNLIESYPNKKLYLRFHALLGPEYDPLFANDNKPESHRNIETLVDFISENYGGGYLVLHSNTSPDEYLTEKARQLFKNSLGKGVVLALENLAEGWSSDVRVFSDFLLKSGFKGVVDLGHLNSSDCLRFSSLKRCEAIEILSPYLVGAHIYEHEKEGHHPFSDYLITGDALQQLLDIGIDWWVIELEDPEAFLSVFDLVNGFLVSMNRE